MIQELNEENEKDFLDLERKLNLPIQHTISWKKVIEKTYKNVKIICFFNKEKEMIFPATYVKSSLFGNKIVSQSFIDFGGFTNNCDKSFIEEVLRILQEKYSKDIVIKMNNFFEENERIFKVLEKNGFKKIANKNQIILQIKDEEEMWNGLKRVTRKGVNKALKNNLNIRKIDSLKELKNFYKIYLKNQKDFGSPQHSFKFFENWFEEKNHFVGFNCYNKGKIVGGLIGFYNKNYLYAAYQGIDRIFQRLQGNDLLHWELLRWCSHNKIKHFDFGECELNPSSEHAEGILNFKMKWLGEGDKILEKYKFVFEEENESGKKDKLKKFRKVWSKIPTQIIKLIGPKVTSHLGI